MASPRIGGLNSGMDTEAIIKILVDAKKQPIDRLQEKVNTETEKFNSWSEVDTKLSELRSASSDLTSYVIWNQMSATSSDTSAFTATASIAARAATYNVSVSDLATKAKQTSADQSGSVSSSSEALNKSGSFKINGATISFDTTDSLDAIATRINEAAANGDMSENATAYTIGTTLIIESENTGASSNVTISDTTGDDLFSGGTATAGTDLHATIDGIALTSSKNTDIDSFINGVTFNFTDTTIGTTTLTVSPDKDTIKSLIKTFIEKYNDTMEYMEKQSFSRLNSSGDVAATGTLQGESLVKKIQSQARLILTGINEDPRELDQDFNTFYKIGIWTEDRSNRLAITDEDKLDDALTNHYDEVMNLFRDSDGGIMKKFDDYLYQQTDPIEGTVTMRKNALDDQLNKWTKEIQDKTLGLYDYEAMLWDHFANMENAVGNINNQMNFMNSILGVNKK